jgi:Ca2+-binding EF-hand superfamily protein
MANETPNRPASHPVVREFYRDSKNYATMGEQYNNLGNITQGRSGMWPGQKGIGWSGSNRAFKAFATVEDGVAAQAFLLERYVNRNGDRSVGDIISRYAPPSENNTGSYTAHVLTKVNTIAKSLGYGGPAITAGTDLQKAFGDKQNGDIVLSAMVKAMNEVEVGTATSNRLAPPEKVLAAVRGKYRKQYGSYEGYSRAIGADPNVRAPARTHSGVADTDESEWVQPDDRAIDDVATQMLMRFIGKLLEMIFGKSFGLDSGRGDDAPSAGAASVASAPPVELDVARLVPDALLRILGAAGASDAAMGARVALFDLDHNGHITRDDLPEIRKQLQTSGVTLPADANDSQVLTAYAQKLVQAQNQGR